MRHFLLALMLMLAGCAHVPAVASEQRLPASYVEDLASFVRLASGRDYQGPIKVVFKTPEQLNRIYFGSKYDGQDRRCDAFCVKAIHIDGVIMLGTDFEQGRDDYILAHEIDHVMQFHDGLMSQKDYCPGNAEREAYDIQSKFVDATGRGTKPDPVLLFMLTQCRPPF